MQLVSVPEAHGGRPPPPRHCPLQALSAEQLAVLASTVACWCMLRADSLLPSRFLKLQGLSALQIVTKLKCSAERFKWLWAIQGVLEKIMLRECKTVAETFVSYCSRIAHEGAAAVCPTICFSEACRLSAMPMMRSCLLLPCLHALATLLAALRAAALGGAA